MKHSASSRWAQSALLMVLLAALASSCTWTPEITVTPTDPPTTAVSPYMKMDPPADSDKPLPVPPGDNSCWMHSAANVLAGAGYGSGVTVQERAEDIFADMEAHYGTANRGWPDAAIQWWLQSSHNAWPDNPYTLVTVHGNKSMYPWADQNGARELANELRSCNLVSLAVSWPTDAQGVVGQGGHALTAWGDDVSSVTALATNPEELRVTDSDTDDGGDVQVYVYDAYSNPNPGGPNEGNGWYFDYGDPHPYIRCLITLSPTDGPSGPDSVRVTGSYRIRQTSEQAASDLHYRVSTDVDILTYRTWLDWPGRPIITEAVPRQELTVDWELEEGVPQDTWVTISTEFVEPAWNAISYHDVHFTYPEDVGAAALPDLIWNMETPVIDGAEAVPSVTGGYVVGSFDVYDPEMPDETASRYRFVHQYLYNQLPEFHILLLSGTPGFVVTNLSFGHSYGYPTVEELWQFEERTEWMTQIDDAYELSDDPIEIAIDWEGKLPYPEGLGANGR